MQSWKANPAKLIPHCEELSVRPRRPRIVWTEAEKDGLIRQAVEIQRKRPDLAGLPLLRAAMKILPDGRRRKLITLGEAPWFEPAMQRTAETEARARADSLESDVAAIRAAVSEILGILKAR